MPVELLTKTPVMRPLPSVLMRYASRSAEPKERVVPAMIYPPSEVCRTKNPRSSKAPPYVRVQIVSPREFDLMRYTSEKPAPLDSVYLVMIYPLSDVCW